MMVKKWRSIWGGERDTDRRESLPSIGCRLQYDVQYYDGSHIMVLSKGMAYLSLGRSLWSGKYHWGSQEGNDYNVLGRTVCVA